MSSTNSNYTFRYAIICVIGVGLWIYSWYLPLYEGKYSIKMALLGPFFAILGFGFLFGDNDPDSEFRQAFERTKETGEKFRIRDYPFHLKAICFIAVIAAIANAAVIRNYFG